MLIKETIVYDLSKVCTTYTYNRTRGLPIRYCFKCKKEFTEGKTVSVCVTYETDKRNKKSVPSYNKSLCSKCVKGL